VQSIVTVHLTLIGGHLLSDVFGVSTQAAP
jgi:hypothetical protein